MSFSGKVVVVTGAASGIGAAIALSFAKQHASLCIVDVNKSELIKTTERCQALCKNKIIQLVADLKKDEDVDEISIRTLKEFGKIDVLVNCAAIYRTANLTDPHIIENFDEIIANNLRSVIVTTKKILPALTLSKGCIINISSNSSNLVIPNSMCYCMSKAGVTNFTKHAALELASLGIRVNCISPGPVRTNIINYAGLSETGVREFWDNLAKQNTPMQKCVKAEEIAEMAVYLASDKAASITGSDFLVDAGMALGTGKTNIQVPTTESK